MLEESHGVRWMEASGLGILAYLEAMLEHTDEARELYGRTRAIYEELGMTFALAARSFIPAGIETMAGNPAGAERELLAGYEALEAIGETELRSTVAASLAENYASEGRDDEAEEYSRISEQIAASDDFGSQILWRGARARALARRDGDPGRRSTRPRRRRSGGDDGLSQPARQRAARSRRDVDLPRSRRGDAAVARRGDGALRAEGGSCLAEACGSGRVGVGDGGDAVTNVAVPGADALRAAPLLRGASAQAVEQLRDAGSERRVAARDWLFHEGEPSDKLFVVLSGRLQAVDSDGRVLRELGVGAALGELGLLTGSPRSASVRAVRDCRLLEIDAEHFARLVEEDGALAASIARELARQLQASGGLDLPEVRPSVFAVVSADRSGLRKVSAALARALEAFGTIARLDGEGVAVEEYGPALDRAEREFDHVLLVEGAEPSWTEFCRRQCDRLLVVVSNELPAASGTSEPKSASSCSSAAPRRRSSAGSTRFRLARTTWSRPVRSSPPGSSASRGA